MYKYILPALCALTIFFGSCAVACAQGPTRSTTTHKCSGEVITRVHTKAVKTPRLLGNVTHIWGGNRGFRGATRFDRWSSKRRRVHRKFKVGRK